MHFGICLWKLRHKWTLLTIIVILLTWMGDQRLLSYNEVQQVNSGGHWQNSRTHSINENEIHTSPVTHTPFPVQLSLDLLQHTSCYSGQKLPLPMLNTPHLQYATAVPCLCWAMTVSYMIGLWWGQVSYRQLALCELLGLHHKSPKVNDLCFYPLDSLTPLFTVLSNLKGFVHKQEIMIRRDGNPGGVFL